ncbi:hypothetical protein DL770_010776 [Monosporascus sp. CRB-9-2]|nr:hypothetical protein DL770_010776 [Monosporascus sp. CRB-9-2]
MLTTTLPKRISCLPVGTPPPIPTRYRHLTEGKRTLVALIVSSNLPFAFADNQLFRGILDYLNPSVAIKEACLSGPVIRYMIIQQYNLHRQKVVDILRNSPGKIHVSFDGWTSPNQLALYGIVCFYRNDANRLCKILLGIPEAGRHFGSSIAGEVLDILYAFGITGEKIGYFKLDNAENNNTAMEVIGAELGFQGHLRRGRCVGHTIIIAAKALLFGTHPDAFEQQLTGAEALTEAEYQTGDRRDWEDWEKDHRSKRTGRLSQAKLARLPRILCDENQLTDNDWEVLFHLEAILTVFETVVKTLEGDGQVRKRRQGWLAMALHPAYRWDWFEETWQSKLAWIERAEALVNEVWVTDYAHLDIRAMSRGNGKTTKNLGEEVTIL